MLSAAHGSVEAKLPGIGEWSDVVAQAGRREEERKGDQLEDEDQDEEGFAFLTQALSS
jgi:hypothetical protein